jgi:hypothetical protein
VVAFRGKIKEGRRLGGGTNAERREKKAATGRGLYSGLFQPNGEKVVRPDLPSSAEWPRTAMTPAAEAFSGFLQM